MRKTMRLALVVVACGALAVLGVRDLLDGEVTSGIAAILFAVGNGLLLR